MRILLILIHFIPLGLCAQSGRIPTKSDLTKIYTRAIGDFINAANKKTKTGFDTLFFGKRINGQPDDFPDIELPETINKTQVWIITPEIGARKQKERKSRFYINLVGWVTEEKAEFIFVVFSNGFDHQYDYHINYKYNTQRKKYEIEKSQFKDPPFD